MQIFYFLAVLLGPLVKLLYSFIGNYAGTMVVATIVIKLVLFRCPSISRNPPPRWPCSSR